MAILHQKPAPMLYVCLPCLSCFHFDRKLTSEFWGCWHCIQTHGCRDCQCAFWVYVDSQRVLAKPLSQNKLCTFLEQELGSLDSWINSHLNALIRLPGQKHAASCVLGEVSWLVLSTFFPKLYVLQEFCQELEPENVKCHLFLCFVFICFTLCQCTMYMYC